MTPRVEHALDTLVRIAGKLLGFLGNSVIRHRAETILCQLWSDGYVLVRRSEIHNWRVLVHELTISDKLSPQPEKMRAELKLIASAIDHCLHEWQTFHDRIPEQTETRFRTGVNRRDIGKR